MKRVLICTIGLVSCLSVLQAVQPLSKKEMKLYGSYKDYHDRHGNYIEPYAYDDDDSYDDEYDDYDDYDGDDYDDYEEDEEDDDYYDDDQKEHEGKKQVSYVYNATRAGDQQLKITVGAGLPLNFGTPFSDEDKIKLGGYGTFGYHFFLTDWFAVGADIGFGFNPTIAGHTFNHVPTVAVATLQPSIGNFEFPIAVGVGAAWETYNGETYWPGLVLVGEVGARYKISQSWGVGLDASYKMMPQFARNWNTGEETITGTFLTISACANYYF
ncbi:MAG: hypothetical protein IJR93_11960 [Treponema sp.]|nr:hypothetical protein [Treponema sp.]